MMIVDNAHVIPIENDIEGLLRRYLMMNHD